MEGSWTGAGTEWVGSDFSGRVCSGSVVCAQSRSARRALENRRTEPDVTTRSIQPCSPCCRPPDRTTKVPAGSRDGVRDEAGHRKRVTCCNRQRSHLALVAGWARWSVGEDTKRPAPIDGGDERLETRQIPTRGRGEAHPRWRRGTAPGTDGADPDRSQPGAQSRRRGHAAADARARRPGLGPVKAPRRAGSGGRPSCKSPSRRVSRGSCVAVHPRPAGRRW